MNISSVVVDNFAFEYHFEDARSFLMVTVKTSALRAALLAWTPEDGARFFLVERDSSFGVECRKEATKQDFPLSDAVSLVLRNQGAFQEKDHFTILRILGSVGDEPHPS